eukprot:9203627-Pyramimonas_sp.AAC.1
MHQPTPSTHRNRLRMGFENQVSGGWVGCLREQWKGQLQVEHWWFEQQIGPRRLRRMDCAT